MSIVALYQIARGEPVDALLEQLDTLSGGLADPVVQSVMEWLHGELAFSVGDHARAYDAYLRGAEESTTLNAYLMAAASRAAAWQGDPVRLRVTLDRLDANPDVTLYAKAGRAEGHACLSALDGDIPAAVGGFIAALRSFAQVGVRFDQAMCALTFVRMVGPSVPEARAAAEEARTIFESVGARPYLERLDAELARPSTPPARSGSTRRPASRPELASVAATWAPAARRSRADPGPIARRISGCRQHPKRPFVLSPARARPRPDDARPTLDAYDDEGVHA